MESKAQNAESNENHERPDAASRVSGQALLAARLFAFLNERDVPYVVVGDVRDYEHSVASDIDLVVAEEALHRMPQVFADFAAANDGRFVQVIRHEPGAFYFALAHLVDCQFVFLHPDVCAAYARRGRQLMSARELLAGRFRAPFGGYVPAAALAFAYYFVKKVDKGSLDARAFAYLRGLWESDRIACIDRLTLLFGREQVPKFTNAFDQAELEAVTAMIGELKRSLDRTHPVTWSDRWAGLWRASDRWSRPTGLWVAFYGPDGAGKSSVIERVEARLTPAFRRAVRYHLRPHLGRRSSSSVPSVTAPHGQPVRGLPASLAKAVYWFLDATLGYWLRIRPQLVRSTLVIFDRYVDDLGVDPKRYRFRAPAWIAEGLRRSTPRPDVVVVLDAPGDVLQSRKEEVPPAESERQSASYRALAARTRGAVVVDAAMPLPEVVNAVESAVLDHLAERTAHRFGLV